MIWSFRVPWTQVLKFAHFHFLFILGAQDDSTNVQESEFIDAQSKESQPAGFWTSDVGTSTIRKDQNIQAAGSPGWWVSLLEESGVALRC